MLKIEQEEVKEEEEEEETGAKNPWAGGCKD